MSENPYGPNPLLFISHKHTDSKIADVINDFVTIRSGGRVKVFQSSSPWAAGPHAGRNLNKQLKEALWQTNVFILIYTAPDQDWNYCMFECGVASHPQSPNTRVILFQCGTTRPSLFADQVNVNCRNLPDIQKFTDDLLTDPTFFSGFPGAITQFARSGREVAAAAAELYQKLLVSLPPEIELPVEEWPAWPFLQLELSLDTINQISKADDEGSRRQ
jgi:hypothetical protein